jgi:magnesium transporter
MFFAVELNFESKAERKVALDELSSSHKKGHFCWIDLSAEDVASTETVLSEYCASPKEPIAAQLERNIARVNDADDWMHFQVSEASVDGNHLTVGGIDVFFGDGFMLTVHPQESSVIEGMKNSYGRNFLHVAKSYGFLHFELVDHLTRCYSNVQHQVADQTEKIETELFENSDDAIFGKVATLMRTILEFSKIVIDSREVFHDMSTRLSPFIPQTTQPFLEKKAGLLDRMCADITTEREVLSESLNLYMGIVTHRTNHFVTRLTVISALFLPLSFLVGVYGMNFRYMPELQLPYGYGGFWCLVVLIVGGLSFFMKRGGWM